MSEEKMRVKKGKNFKEIIEDEKKKGKTSRRIMKQITHIDSSLLYALSFLLPFVALDALLYSLFKPDVFIWAGILVGSALFCSIFASYLTKTIKKQQWRYASEP
jgi:membrane protein YdbS with pleckstrin-like domain